MERARVRFNFPSLILILVVIFDPSKSIRQSEIPWSQPGRHSAGKPFAHEINCTFAVVPDVGANIEKMMGGDRSQKQLADSAAKSWPHSTHRECNEADKRSSLVEIEMVRHAALQFLRTGFVRNENSPIRSLPRAKSPADCRREPFHARTARSAQRRSTM